MFQSAILSFCICFSSPLAENFHPLPGIFHSESCREKAVVNIPVLNRTMAPHIMQMFVICVDVCKNRGFTGGEKEIEKKTNIHFKAFWLKVKWWTEWIVLLWSSESFPFICFIMRDLRELISFIISYMKHKSFVRYWFFQCLSNDKGLERPLWVWRKVWSLASILLVQYTSNIL